MRIDIQREDTSWAVYVRHGERMVAAVMQLPTMRAAADIRCALRSAYAVGAIDGLEQARSEYATVHQSAAATTAASPGAAETLPSAAPVSSSSGCYYR